MRYYLSVTCVVCCSTMVISDISRELANVVCDYVSWSFGVIPKHVTESLHPGIPRLTYDS